MNRVIFGIEIVTAIFMLVILYGVIFETKLDKLKNKLFLSCVVVCIVALVVDGVSWKLDGLVEYSNLIRFFSVFSSCMGGIILGIFAFYIICIIQEHKQISFLMGYIVTGILLVAIFVSVYLGASGISFKIEDGYYVPTVYKNIPIAFEAVAMASILVLILINSKHLGRHDCVILLVYMLIPAIAVGFNILKPEMAFSLVGIAISLTLVYIFVQSKEINNSELTVQLLNQASHLDSLTTLKNRRSYEFTISTLVPEFNYAVFFADVNNLKYTNDTFGHVAGDKLIVNFKNILVEHFSRDAIFRISGDEFVVIIQKNDRDFIEEKLHTLKSDIAVKGGIASVGCSFGPGADILQVIKEAERDMYSDKNAYYERSGINRRI